MWLDWGTITRRQSGQDVTFGPNFNLKEPDFRFSPINYQIHILAVVRKKIKQKRALLSYRYSYIVCVCTKALPAG